MDDSQRIEAVRAYLVRLFGAGNFDEDDECLAMIIIRQVELGGKKVTPSERILDFLDRYPIIS
jgi:hypothetical protein